MISGFCISNDGVLILPYYQERAIRQKYQLFFTEIIMIQKLKLLTFEKFCDSQKNLISQISFHINFQLTQS